MPYPKFDRNKLEIKRLSERENKVYIERDHVPVNQLPRALGKSGFKLIDKTVSRIRKARDLNRPVMLAFGAHTIKNGMDPTLIALITEGWVTHLATNGAGISIITMCSFGLFINFCSTRARLNKKSTHRNESISA